MIGWQAIIRKRGFSSQAKTFRTKRNATQETSHIHILLATSLAKQSLASIGSRQISRYRNTRLKIVFGIDGQQIAVPR
ncbi:hypothetical protein [Acidithiobacillus ferriphilus]|uniref:hypothetical protein n=1 Tax=Acidithiobacillus ferriphilus TaxID=1689834 RepID=UPI001C071D05|nr:hypothetical protein [Acidithiobacillus ferriphilus]